MGPEDFVEIGITGKGDRHFNKLVECPKCAAVVRAEFGLAYGLISAVERHIQWHQGLFDGWEDA